MRVSLSLIGLFYIIVVGKICHLLDISTTMRAILALLSLLIIPYLVGKTLSLLLKKFLYIEFNFDVISNFIINWCIGLIFIVSTAYLLNYFWLFDAKLFVLFLIILMIPAAFYKEEHENISNFINTYGGKIPILLSILIGVIMSLFITTFSPYPYTNATDYIVHDYWSFQLIEYNFFLLSKIYLLTHSILYSIPTLIFNLKIDSLKLWWHSRFILYPLYSFGLYIFSYEISKNKKLSLIAVFIGTFIAYHKEGFMFLYHTSPKTIVFLLFPLFLFFAHKIIIEKLKITEIENKKFIQLYILIFLFFIIELIFLMVSEKIISDFIGVILLLFLIMILVITKYLKNNERVIFFSIICMITVLLFFHIGNGFFASFFILLYLFISFFIKKQPTLSRFLIYSIVIFSLLFFILQMEGVIGFKKHLISVYGTASSFSIEPLWKMINDIYPTTILSLFLIGAVFALFYNKDRYISLIFLVSIIFLIFFSPIKDMYRILIYLNPFIAFFCAYSLIECYDIIFSFKNSGVKNVKPIFISLIIVIAIISPLVNCIDEINKITSREDKEGYFTMFTPSRFLASEYIKSNISKNTIILGHHGARYYASYSKTRYPCGSALGVFLTENAKKAYEKINILINNKSFTCHNYNSRPNRCKQQLIDKLNAIVIFDETTETWIKINTNKQDIEAINKFYNTTYFTLLYSDKKHNIYIFGVNPEPGVPFELVNNPKS